MEKFYNVGLMDDYESSGGEFCPFDYGNLNIEDSDEFGDSPLIYSITQAKLTCFNLLLTNGVDVNRQRMNDKMTPLMMASMSGQLDMVRLLLAHGANKKLKNLNSFTAKDLAENEGRVEIVKILS
jgi:ankyrin repeat protein